MVLSGSAFGKAKSPRCRHAYAYPSLGAAGTSTIMGVMLSHFGLRRTMLIKAGVDAIVIGAAFLLIKERRKPSATIVWYDKKYLTDPTFWSITLCMFLTNFGYPAPLFYLPTYAKQKIPNLTELVGPRSYCVLINREDLYSIIALCPLCHHSQHIIGDWTLLRWVPW